MSLAASALTAVWIAAAVWGVLFWTHCGLEKGRRYAARRATLGLGQTAALVAAIALAVWTVNLVA